MGNRPRVNDRGDILFGRWHYKNGETRPIVWEKKGELGDSYILVSKKVVDYRPYHHHGNGLVKYKDSDLRRWLNSEFYNGAFTNEEKQVIESTSVYISADDEYVSDYVYLLTEKQVNDYYKTNEDRVKHARPYVYETSTGYSGNEDQYGFAYWLRDYFKYDFGDTSSFSFVNYDGTIWHRFTRDQKRGVVPVIRIKKSSLIY